MRCALFLAAWTVALAVAEPALGPVAPSALRPPPAAEKGCAPAESQGREPEPPPGRLPLRLRPPGTARKVNHCHPRIKSAQQTPQQRGRTPTAGRPNCTTNRHHQGHPEAVECIPEEHEKAHNIPSTTRHASSTRTTTTAHPSTTKTSTPLRQPPKTRPPVDEFLAAWGYFKHHNSLDPHNASHWREFHGVNGPHAPRRRDVAKRNDVVVIMPPWLRQPAHPGLAFVVPPARHMAKREQQPPRPGLTFVVPPVEPGARLVKREEQPNGSTAAPYQVYWFSSWPPAGREVSRLPGRDKANFVKLADWWQDVIRTYNGHHRKKRGLQRR
ncbi:hypothetical protein MRX96_041443 [Rhipicephalus microplus]